MLYIYSLSNEIPSDTPVLHHEILSAINTVVFVVAVVVHSDANLMNENGTFLLTG